MSGPQQRHAPGHGTTRRTLRLAAALAWIGLVALCGHALAEDWPTYRHDVARSGVTSEEVRPPLSTSWVYQPGHAPRPAWGDPNPRRVGGWHGLVEKRRVHFDDVFQVAVADGALYFGSSATGKVTALDVATGKARWTFLTGGPVRLAPAVVNGKVYVASDDGYAYCLRASDGAEVWRFRAAPNDTKLLGSSKMISLWPLRSGVLVDDGVVYLAAGIFPAEGVYFYALDADDGKLLWCNDTTGASPQSRIAPQGYLLASKDMLYVPLGRVSPAAFDRKTGRLIHQTYFTHYIGGTYALLADDTMYTGTEELVAYDPKSPKKRFAWFYGRQLIITKDVSYTATDTELLARDRKTYPQASLRLKALRDRKRDVAGRLGRARRNQRNAQNVVNQSERAVKAVEQKSAAATGRGAPAAELQALEPERTAAHKKLARDTRALDGARKAAAKALATVNTVNAELKKVNDTIEASQKWRCPSTCADVLILAGGVLYAGGKGQVLAVDAATGQKLADIKVEGNAKGLAVAGGRLFISTDTGAIYCLGSQGARPLGTVREPVNPSPYPQDALTPVFRAAADHILEATGVKKGYCLVLGSGTGRLIHELARRTELQFCAIEADPKKAAAARKALDAAGLYGARVHIEQGDLARVPFSDYFANLVVSETALTSGVVPGSAKEAFRMLKPLGGTICIGQPPADVYAKQLDPAALRRWLDAGGVKGGDVLEDGGTWLSLTRGPLPGAGSWTHQYAEPGNTACSDDQLVKCPLGLLWFGQPGPGDMIERHRRSSAPLSVGGRLFIQGFNVLMAYDAYNGLKLWERKVPGAMRVSISHDASNLAANEDALFVAVGDKCLRLDPATGKTTLTYTLPKAADGKPRTWGYVATVGDLLYGTRSAQARLCDCVFALDVATGALRWKYEGTAMPQGAIAIGDGKLFLANGNVSAAQKHEALKDLAAQAATLQGAERAAAERKLRTAVVQRIVALDAKTGKPVWERPIELTEANRGAYWCSLGAIYSRDVLVLFGVFLDGHYWRQFFAGQFKTRRIIALAGKTGRGLWTKHIGYRVRPLVVGDTLHAEPWAFDLRTGKQKMRTSPITGREEIWQFARPGHHCGSPAAAPNVMLFRSYTLGWYDLVGDYGTQHFGAQRPGCWINFIPANGLLMVPEASSGCMCPFPNSFTVVFKPRAEGRQWAYYSQPGDLTPVKRLAINLGAPGDRRAPDGTLWLGYPRPGGSLVLQFKIMATRSLPGWGWFKHDPARLEVKGTDAPWVFRNGVRGLRRFEIPLLKPGDGAARYTVRLAFAELDLDAPGSRVFDVKLQGKVVLEDFDVLKAAGGRNKAVVREFEGIDVEGKLQIELLPKAAKPTPEQLPVLQGIDIQREKVLSLGVTIPSFILNDAEPAQEHPIHIANHKGAAFVGTLRIESPDGFTVTPAEAPIKLASGERTDLTLKAALARKGPRGKYPVVLKLVGQDGATEWQGQAPLEYLGAIGRKTLKAVEDAYVGKAFATTNRGGTAKLYVDGGDSKMGDQSHHITYLKFKLDLPGKPISALLRLYNAGNPTGGSGNVCLVTQPWSEKSITYNNRPKPGQPLARLGGITENQIVEVPLKLSLEGKTELSLVIDPVNCDGVDYFAREGGKPAELIVEYQQ